MLPPIDLYVNAGFVGLHRERIAFLDDWERYLVAMALADDGPGLVLSPARRRRARVALHLGCAAAALLPHRA